nr:hypothetical protein [uncultured Caproiciproducens sp.]
MKIFEFLNTIRQDQELKEIIMNSPEVFGSYKPRNYPGRRIKGTPAKIATDYFWGSINGAKFRCLCEEKYGSWRGDKDAVFLFIQEARQNAGIDN